jgi:GT2 family glycosyltransferase
MNKVFNISEITAVIVLYNTTNLVFKCLDSIIGIKIIIVDNGKNSQTMISLIKNKYNILKYFKFKKNIGFGRACNFAFKYVQTPYTLLIEPDVVIDKSSIKNLLLTLEKYPNTAITTPRFVDENFKIIDYLGNFQENGKGVVRNKLEENINYRLSKNLIDGDTCINFCLAAILLINNQIIKKVGLFNKKIFLYWEDFDLCRRLKINKIPIIKSYESTAIHLERKSVKESIINKFIMTVHNDKSAYIYFNVKKNNLIIFKRMFLYTFRFMTYIFIFNIKKSLKNLARLYAIYLYLKK